MNGMILKILSCPPYRWYSCPPRVPRGTLAGGLAGESSRLPFLYTLFVLCG
jgi:hypothetical protein